MTWPLWHVMSRDPELEATEYREPAPATEVARGSLNTNWCTSPDEDSPVGVSSCTDADVIVGVPAGVVVVVVVGAVVVVVVG